MNEQTQNYVRQHADDDVRMLALRGVKDPAIDLPFALQQIQGRQTARRKLPSWAANPVIVFPPHLNMEQCSSESTALYKASLCRRLLSSTIEPSLLDLTGGLGVDFSFMQAPFRQATYIERDPELCDIAAHNFAALGFTVKTVNADGPAFFDTVSHVTLTYLDPARRDDNGARTYGIADCTPNVLAFLSSLLQKSNYVLLKLSPMLDWRKAVADLGADHVREVHIVSLQNECKELLILLSASVAAPAGDVAMLHCVNDGSSFVIPLSADSGVAMPPLFSDLSTLVALLPDTLFLYEPNASVMKAGCFDELCHRFDVHQISHDSHLFVSLQFLDDFPGRRFQFCTVSSLNKHELKSVLKGLTHANITTRNFPLTVAELRRRLKLSDGGDTYIFATTLPSGEHVLIFCRK